MNITLASQELNNIQVTDHVSTTRQVNNALQQIMSVLSNLNIQTTEHTSAITQINTTLSWINNTLHQITSQLSNLNYIQIENDSIETVVNTVNTIISVFKSEDIPSQPDDPPIIDPIVEQELKKYNDLIVNENETLNLATNENDIQTVQFYNGQLQSSSNTTDESDVKILLIDNFNATNVYELFILDNVLHTREVLNIIDKTEAKKSIILTDQLTNIQYKLYIYNGSLYRQQI